MSKKNLSRHKVRQKTTLDDYLPFLHELTTRHRDTPPVVMGGHAVNYWLDRYSGRFDSPERHRPKLGKDLDLLLDPKIVAEDFMDSPNYSAPAVFISDLLFYSLRKYILRNRITPFALWYICRSGKTRTLAPDGRTAVEVDFFAHTLGYHPGFVRRRALQVTADGETFYVMDPIHSLWQFIANAATLHQTRGDSGPRRRSDHLRCRQLIPVVRFFLKGIQNGEFPDIPLERALGDLALIISKPEARAVRDVTADIDWKECLPAGLAEHSVGKAAKSIRTILTKADQLHQPGFLFKHQYPKPAPSAA